MARTASKKWGLQQDISGGVNFAVWNADGKTSIAGERAQELKATKQKYRECIQKAVEYPAERNEKCRL